MWPDGPPRKVIYWHEIGLIVGIFAGNWHLYVMAIHCRPPTIYFDFSSNQLAKKSQSVPTVTEMKKVQCSSVTPVVSQSTIDNMQEECSVRFTLKSSKYVAYWDGTDMSTKHRLLDAKAVKRSKFSFFGYLSNNKGRLFT